MAGENYMLEALATIGILIVGCAIEGVLAVIAVKTNVGIVDRQFKRNSPGENS